MIFFHIFVIDKTLYHEPLTYNILTTNNKQRTTMKALIKNTLILAFLFTFTTTYAQETNTEIKKDPFVFVENPPEYPGGDKARLSFLSENIHYPKDAIDAGIQGNIYVQFIIEKDGSVSNVKILRGITPSMDKEVIRVIKLMPKWKPGTQKGRAVRAQFNMPVRFILEDDNPKKMTKKEKRALKKKQKAEAKAKESNE